jgi:signal transduction histidine kinase
VTPARLKLRLPGLAGDTSRQSPAELFGRYRSYFLAGMLTFRGLSAAPPLVILIGRYGLWSVFQLVAIWLVAVSVNFAAIPLVLHKRILSTRDVLPWLLLDASVAVGLNLWGAAHVPGSVDDPYHDLFFFWCLGTVGLWTVWLGTWAGVVVSLASIPLQLGMSLVSSGELAGSSLSMVVGRTTWLLVGAAGAGLILWIIRVAAEGVRAEGVRAVQKSAQIAALRELHDTALQTLEAIGLTAENERLDPRRRLEAVSRAARLQAEDIRATLTDDSAAPEVDALRALAETVRGATDALQAAGVEISLRSRYGDPLLMPLPRSEALCHGVQEALNNVRKHSAATSTVVDASVRPDRLEVTVRDDGRGFDPARGWGFGIRHSLLDRLDEAGGAAEIRSATSWGTVVTLWVPR